MNQSLTIQFYDLASRYHAKKLRDASVDPSLITQVVRQMNKQRGHHVILTGAPGSGKSRFVDAFAFRQLHTPHTGLPSRIYLLKTDPLINLLIDGGTVSQCVQALEQSLHRLGPSIIVIEDIHLLFGDDPDRNEAVERLLSPFLSHYRIHLFLTGLPDLYERLIQSRPLLHRHMSHITLPPLSEEKLSAILEEYVQLQTKENPIQLPEETKQEIIRLSKQFSQGRAQPDAALRLLDDAIAECWLHKRHELTSEHITSLVSQREGVSVGKASNQDTKLLLSLEDTLNQHITGQQEAIRTIVHTIQRSRLGFTDTTRPQASFLFLGPSGVGKTETAKQLAELLFPTPGSFVRLDMSEFSEAHTTVRLIGSPPGYVGYEEGGQLTNPVARQPSCLILLDEIEKAHPKVFDLFLQVLDDGRLTDSSGKTVDFRHTIIVATSNCASREINQALSQERDVTNPAFMNDTILPVLAHQFRLEFLNRFDALLVFRPLSLDHLVTIAATELAELQQRLAKRRITFSVSSHNLRSLLQPFYNPAFGARPVRRLIAERFESPLIHYLLSNPQAADFTITGEEPWLLN